MGLSESRVRVFGFPLAALLAALVLTAAWRFSLAVGVVLHPTVEANFGAFAHWRRLDQFTGWIMLLLLPLGAATERGRVVAGGRPGGSGTSSIFTLLPLGGILLVACSSLWESGVREMAQELVGQKVIAGGDQVSTVIGLWLAVTAGLLVVRELWEISRKLSPARGGAAGSTRPGGGGGLNLVDLWRLLAVQWVLVWMAAALFLRLKFSGIGLVGNDQAREVLSRLPVAGLVPNFLAILALRWWWLAAPPVARPRIRAWVLAMFTINLGAAMAVIPLPGLQIAGAILLIVGLGLFLLGFPRGTFAATAVGGGGKLLPLAVLVGVVGLAMPLFGPAVRSFTAGRMAFYSAGAYQLVAVGFPLMVLVALGARLMRTVLPRAFQMVGAMRVAAALLLAGPAVTALVYVLAATLGTASGAFTGTSGGAGSSGLAGHETVPALPFLFLGPLLELSGLLVATAAMVRALKMRPVEATGQGRSEGKALGFS